MIITGQKNSEQGQVLIVAVILMGIILFSAGTLVTATLVYNNQVESAYLDEAAFQLAEAGIEKAIYEFNLRGASYIGELGAVLGEGEFDVVISSIGSETVVESTGYIPDKINTNATKTLRVVINKSTTGVSFVYGVQVGYGGLIMKNNSQILGSIYSNGNIEGSVGTSVTGDAYVAGGASVTPDQEQIVNTGDHNVGDIEAREDASQSFVPSATNNISRVSLLIRKVGNASNATIRIVPDDSGSPSDSTLTSGTLNSGSVGSGFGWVDVSFSSNPELISGRTYWIVFDVGIPKSNKYYVWAKHDNSGYGNGVGKYSHNWSASNPNWQDADGDFGFKTWMGAGSGEETKLSSMDVGGDAHANTIEGSTISGDAYYQTISGTTVSGIEYPGSEDPPTLDMPVSESVILDYKTAAAAGGVITPPGGKYEIDGTTESLGPVKIEGDLLLTNGSTLTVTGPIWVEGDIEFTNNSTVRLSASFGLNSTIIIADYPSDTELKGKIKVDNNAQVFGSGDPDSYIMLLSTYSKDGDKAVEVKNNSDGAIFYAPAGMIEVSNNALLREVVAYKLQLDNNTVVSYESGLSNVNFSTGPTGGWSIKTGSWQILNP